MCDKRRVRRKSKETANRANLSGTKGGTAHKRKHITCTTMADAFIYMYTYAHTAMSPSHIMIS